MGQPFMDFIPKHDTWDAGKMRPMAMFEVDDEGRIYYLGKPTDVEMDNPKFSDARRIGNYVGLAMLPRNRFASINSGEQAGTLLTRPLNFRGGTPHINVDVAESGSRLARRTADRRLRRRRLQSIERG